MDKILNLLLLIGVYLTIIADISVIFFDVIISLMIGFGSPNIIVFIMSGLTLFSLIRIKNLLKSEL